MLMSENHMKWVREAIRYETDSICGSEIEQLTSEPVTSTNIYCEQRYASADGSRIAIDRRPFGRPVELWVCDMRTLRLCRIAEGNAVGANPFLNAVYYVTRTSGIPKLMRLDLEELSSRELFTFEGQEPACGAISPDERRFIGGPFHVRNNVYSLCRIDFADGKLITLCEVEDMFNPHVQFDPGNGKRAFIQINRGGVITASKNLKSLTGPLGATLALLDVETGKVSSLPVGRPHTPAITGHEAWGAKSGRIVFTAGHYDVSPSSFVTLKKDANKDGKPPAAAIYSVAPGEPEPTVVADGLLFNHIAVSDDGRFFIGDDHATGRIYVGNLQNGHYLPICDSHTRQGSCQYSHVHAYMTPDNRHVIFNSIVTGIAQVYAAHVPEGFLEKVLVS